MASLDYEPGRRITERMPHPSQILSHQTLYYDPAYYSAWPALVRTTGGDLLLAFTRTGEHLHPSGTLVTMRSKDHGITWSDPVVVRDTVIDDRENGLTVMPDGRIILHVWSTFWRPEEFEQMPPGSYPVATLKEWIKQTSTPEYRAAESLHGSWTMISDDDGHTWAAPQRGPDSVHGGITLQDGSLLIASYRNTLGHCAIYGTPDPLTPWVKFADIPCPTPETHRTGEPHIAQLPSGRIVVMMRYTAIAYDDTRPDLKLWQTWSDDNGRTWAPPQQTAMLGFPPHLLVLHDGRMVCTYGYRRAPCGERACVSRDGITWDLANEIVLRDDNPSHDLGYPASVETAPGEILTVYYQKPAFDPTDKLRHKVGIYATRWRVGST